MRSKMTTTLLEKKNPLFDAGLYPGSLASLVQLVVGVWS